MGEVLATRLLEHGCDLTVYNRTSAKARPLADHGARLVERPVDLADRDIVITMVAGSSDFEEVMAGPQGLLADESRAPALVVDASTVSMAVSSEIREKAALRGVTHEAEAGQYRQRRAEHQHGAGRVDEFEAVGHPIGWDALAEEHDVRFQRAAAAP